MYLTRILTWLLAALAALFLVFSGTGCNAMMSPYGLPKEFSQAAQTFGASVMDQAVWDEMMGRLGAEVINPGLETYLLTRVSLGTRIVGTSGRITLEGDGHGTGEISDAFRETLLQNYRSATSAAERKFFLEILGRAEKGLASEEGTAPGDNPAPPD